jgi:aryl-alcohol dehydrogenase-like predicted oxidoreductase
MPPPSKYHDSSTRPPWPELSSPVATGLTHETRLTHDTGGPEALRRVLDPIASRHGATIPQVALAWLLARSPAIMPIPATTSIQHLQENLDAHNLELTPEDIQSITQLTPEDAAALAGRGHPTGVLWTSLGRL